MLRVIEFEQSKLGVAAVEGVESAIRQNFGAHCSSNLAMN
jgi:hypothetical protein